MPQEKKQSCEAKAKQPHESAPSKCRAGCSCEPAKCLPVVGALLVALAVPLVLGAMKRTRRSRGEKGEAAGCCS